MKKKITPPLTSIYNASIPKDVLFSLAIDAVALNTQLLTELSKYRDDIKTRNKAGATTRAITSHKKKAKVEAVYLSLKSQLKKLPKNKEIIRQLEKKYPNDKWKQSTVKVWAGLFKKKHSS